MYVYIYIYILIGGLNPSEKYEFVTWDDDIPTRMESHNPAMFQTTNHIYIYIIIFFSGGCFTKLTHHRSSLIHLDGPWS